MMIADKFNGLKGLPCQVESLCPKAHRLKTKKTLPVRNIIFVSNPAEAL
jgi:hypothetical protein